MSNQTKIIVLHMKEIIYTVIFVVLGLILLILFGFMFFPRAKDTSNDIKYTPGVYTSTLSVNTTDLEVEVFVDSSHINAVRINNLTDSVAAMYPLMQPTIENISEQICKTQSVNEVTYSDENAYTAQIILRAIEDALNKAINPNTPSP